MSRTPFRERFLRRVEGLIANPRVRVVVANVGDPTPLATLDQVEQSVGRPLPPAVRAFYEEVSNVELVWSSLPEGSAPDSSRPPMDRRIQQDERDNECTARKLTGGRGGIIEVWPAAQVFDGTLSTNYGIEGPLEVDGRSDLADRLYLFDYHSYYRQSALLIDEGGGRVVLGTDDWADAYERSLSFERALDLLVDNLGYLGRTYNAAPDALETELGVSSPGPQLYDRYCDSARPFE